jgi:hypothetical protein
LQQNSLKLDRMQLPQDFQTEILPFLDESEPTPKDALIVRLLEHGWEKRNIKSVLNYLFAVPARLFFKEGDKVNFA